MTTSEKITLAQFIVGGALLILSVVTNSTPLAVGGSTAMITAVLLRGDR